MPWLIFPNRIDVVISLDTATRQLLSDLLDLRAKQAQIDALTARLTASTGALDSAVKANPDPNPND